MLSTLSGNFGLKEPVAVTFRAIQTLLNRRGFHVSDARSGVPSDRQLLLSVQAGDRTSFHDLYRRHASAVLRYAWRLADDSSDAEDLVQEVFATLWAKRRGVALPGESVLPWLLVTCRNHGANLVRKKARTRTVAMGDDEAYATPSDAADDLRWIHDEIDSLGPLDQQICRLCLLEGVPYREAADELGITANGVAKRVERIRRRLLAARQTN